MAIETRREPGRYVAVLDGRDIGAAVYRDDGPQRVFLHTEIESGEEHHGYAHELVRAALDDTRQAGLTPVGQCTLVRAFLEEHPDYAH